MQISTLTVWSPRCQPSVSVVTIVRWAIILMMSLGMEEAVATEVNAIRIEHTDLRDKIIIELDSTAEAHFFSLADPNRAVIDLTHTHVPKHVKVSAKGLVSQVRFGARPDGGMRVVLDVADAVDLNPISNSGSRIELELSAHKHSVTKTANVEMPVAQNSTNAPTVNKEGASASLAPAPVLKAANTAPVLLAAEDSKGNGSPNERAPATNQPLTTAASPSATLVPTIADHPVVDELKISVRGGQTVIEVGLSGDTRATVSTVEKRLIVELMPAELGEFHAPRAVGQVNGFDAHPIAGGGVRLQFQLPTALAFTSNYLAVGSSGRRMLMIVLDASAKSETPSSTESSGLDLSKHHNRPFIVTVDAGHGGVDPGATGHHGTHEKEVTLAIARQLAARLNQQSGIKAVLTRDSDIFLPLRERINRARQAQADLFISIHADAVENSSVAGASVYVLSEHGASSEAAKWLADQQNSADLVGGIKLENKDKALASVLLDLTQSAAMSSSMVAAEKVITQLNTVGEVRKTQVQQAGFVVLKSPDIPSMLIESAYITNPEEEDHLKDPVYQAKLADAVVIGVKQYFKENATPGARVAKR